MGSISKNMEGRTITVSTNNIQTVYQTKAVAMETPLCVCVRVPGSFEKSFPVVLLNVLNKGTDTRELLIRLFFNNNNNECIVLFLTFVGSTTSMIVYLLVNVLTVILNPMQHVLFIIAIVI